RQLSFGLALWTRGMIQELIFRQFGIRLSIVSVGNLLGKLGMSPQRPLYRAYEQDPEKVAEWKEEIFPQIQARARRSSSQMRLVSGPAITPGLPGRQSGRLPWWPVPGRRVRYRWFPPSVLA